MFSTISRYFNATSGAMLLTSLALVPAGANSAARADTSWQPYYSADYSTARDAFRAEATRLAATWPGATQRRFLVPSTRDADLTVDSLYLPPTKETKQLIVLTSGVHGMEAFAGSAVQLLFMREFGPRLDRENTGYLLVHSLNPFGFKYHRRVTEGNVNLNRNFSTGGALYQTPSPSYEKLRSLLEPQGKVRGPRTSYATMAWQLARKLITGSFSKEQLIQAISEGQYISPDGIEFGGRHAEPQVVNFLAELKGLSTSYKDLVVLDLHTGLGDAYQLHLMPGDVDGVLDEDLFKRLFDRQQDADIYEYTPTSTPGFYHTHGDVNNVMAEIRQPGQRVVALTLEFGTNGASVLSKLHALNGFIIENQGFHFGHSSPAVARACQQLYDELFFPSDARWRRNVISRSRSLFQRALSRMQAGR